MLSKRVVEILRAVSRARIKIKHKVGGDELNRYYGYVALAYLAQELGVPRVIAEHVSGVANHAGSMAMIKKENPELFGDGLDLLP